MLSSAQRYDYKHGCCVPSIVTETVDMVQVGLFSTTFYFDVEKVDSSIQELMTLLVSTK